MPLTDKQREYLKSCNHRWNIKTGATGSGKTYLDIAATIPLRVQSCRGDGLIVLLGNTKGTLDRNVLEPMRQLWPGLVSGISSNNTVMIFGKSATRWARTTRSTLTASEVQPLNTSTVTK